MGNMIPRKYNTNLIIGLSVLVVLAAVTIAYFWYTKNSPQEVKSGPQPQHPPQHPTKPIDTRVDLPDSDVPTLVLFWADWCGWSEKLKPDWDRAAAILNADGSGFRAIDFEDKKDNEEVKKAMHGHPNEFKGYPHIRLYPNGYGQGKPSIAFNGNVKDRNEEGLLRFVYSSVQ